MIPLSTHISESNATIKFRTTGIYGIYLSGGFYYRNEGDFKVIIKNISTNEIVKLKYPLRGLKAIVNGRSAVKYAVIDIPVGGDYQISFENIDNLKVHKSMLYPIRLLFPRYVKNIQVELLFVK